MGSVFTAFPSSLRFAGTSCQDKNGIRLRKEKYEEHCFAGREREMNDKIKLQDKQKI
jgi:hypothetical protein